MINLKNKIFVFTALIGLFFLSGCAKERIMKKYYVLDSPAVSTYADSVKTLPYVVVVEPFIARPAYKTKQIALRSDSNELQYYYYHLWAEAPDVGMRFFVWQKIRSLKIFENCLLEVSQNFPKYLIRGTVDVVEMQEPAPDSDFPTAHIKASFELINFKTGKVAVEHSFDRTEALPEESSMNDFVKSVNKMVNQEVNVFIGKITSSVK